jgi:heat shock protein HspQ
MIKARTAKFQIGQIVRHRVFSFRGVIFDIDPEFNNTEEWWLSIPEEVRPHKDQPFYHLLAENSDSEYVAYVSEQNLLPTFGRTGAASAGGGDFEASHGLSPAQSVVELTVSFGIKRRLRAFLFINGAAFTLGESDSHRAPRRPQVSSRSSARFQLFLQLVFSNTFGSVGGHHLANSDSGSGSVRRTVGIDRLNNDSGPSSAATGRAS